MEKTRLCVRLAIKLVAQWVAYIQIGFCGTLFGTLRQVNGKKMYVNEM